MDRYSQESWETLGRAVRSVRMGKGFANTKKWADAVDRSTRVVLGLERGEPQGAGTLERVASVLGWPPDLPHKILSNPSAYATIGLSTAIGASDEPVTADNIDPRLNNIERQIDALWRRLEELGGTVHVPKPEVSKRQEAWRPQDVPELPADLAADDPGEPSVYFMFDEEQSDNEGR